MEKKRVSLVVLFFLTAILFVIAIGPIVFVTINDWLHEVAEQMIYGKEWYQKTELIWILNEIMLWQVVVGMISFGVSIFSIKYWWSKFFALYLGLAFISVLPKVVGNVVIFVNQADQDQVTHFYEKWLDPGVTIVTLIQAMIILVLVVMLFEKAFKRKVTPQERNFII